MATTVFKHPKASEVNEVWAIKTVSGTLLTPMDDDGAACFMAFPTRDDAERAMQSQVDRGMTNVGVVVRLTPAPTTK